MSNTDACLFTTASQTNTTNNDWDNLPNILNDDDTYARVQLDGIEV